MIGTLIVSWYVYTVFVWPYESAIRTAGVIRGCRAPEDAEALIKRDKAREVEALGQRTRSRKRLAIRPRESFDLDTGPLVAVEFKTRGSAWNWPTAALTYRTDLEY